MLKKNIILVQKTIKGDDYMSQKKLLESLIKENEGIITTKKTQENDIHREYLSEMVRDGSLDRVAYGVYITPDVWEDKMMIMQLRKKKIIFSHETALYLHDLTDRDPIQYTVTVPYGYNPSRLKNEGIIVHTVKKELFELGAIYMNTTFGHEVKVYDLERTICDVFKDRNNQDPAVLTDAIRRYVLRKDKDLNKLMRYAEKMRVKKVLKLYLEVLL